VAARQGGGAPRQVLRARTELRRIPDGEQSGPRRASHPALSTVECPAAGLGVARHARPRCGASDRLRLPIPVVGNSLHAGAIAVKCVSLPLPVPVGAQPKAASR